MAAPSKQESKEKPSNNNDTDTKHIAKGLVHRQAFNCKELMNNYPPKYKDGRKKATFKYIAPNLGDDCPGTLIYARRQLIDLPTKIPNPTNFIKNKIFIKPNIYEYTSNTADPNKLHFYVNFADANLFGFYNGSLFAQDEIMTLEHPILASLREKLLAANSENKESKLIPYCRGSIIILNAIQHGYFPQDKLSKIYGNKFAGKTQDKIIKSIVVNKPPVIDNIICMASLMGMLKKYTKAQIDKLLKTAYCGFNGAVCEVKYQQLNENKGNDIKQDEKDNEEKNENDNGICSKQIILHTGNWGCGAFGGNIAVHTMIQIVAAIAAGVDEIYYHAVDRKSMKQVEEGCKILLEELYPQSKNKKGYIKTKLFMSKLYDRGFKWKTPNGT